MWVNGTLTPVIVDDNLPMVKGRPAFAQTKGTGEFWVCLLEKAWAKLIGSYGATIAG